MGRQVDEQIAHRFPVGQRLRVLDVGMGQGTQALRLARAGHKVTGLEQDPAMLAVAQEALAAEPAGIQDRVELLEGDGRETGAHFLPGSFDVVLCHGVLMYVPEPDAMLAGLARMLAPGGLLSLLVRNGDALAMRPGLVADGEYLRAVAEACPFPAAELEGRQLHATFLSAQPAEERFASIDGPSYLPEEYRIGDRVVYLYAPDGLGRSKLGEALHKPAVFKGIDATTRNWNTVAKLVELTAG
ncbi:methyltransferase domain-containing protein [Streptomyces sp. NPDC001193]